jgi:hypothetical protein
MVKLDYFAFNDALNRVWLSRRNAGRPIYLVLDNSRRSELSKILGLADDALESAVCRAVGRSLKTSGDPYQLHERHLKEWSKEGRKSLPPFTALLFALSHAAELMHSDEEVSSSNYYARLKEVTGYTGKNLSSHGAETLKYWQAFSKWLSAKDYTYGRPTARQIGKLVYVGLPISQAIVRAEDRRCFHDLFDKYGFNSADAVGREEMAQYLDSWVHGTAASKRIKTAWSQPDLRDHVSEIAIAELEEWSSIEAAVDVGEGKAASGTRLSWVASIVSSFPKRRLSLGLGRKWEGEGEIELVCKKDRRSFTLANVLYGAFATLSPGTGWVPDALESGLSLSSPNGGRDHVWRPRMVIPFARSASGAFWVEVTRTTLGVEHMVLARDTKRIQEAVETVLAQAAAPGYTRALAAQVLGIPPGWSLYQGVRLLKSLDAPPRDATDLSPIWDAAAIRTEDGMLLLPGIWHGRAPPSVRLDTGGGEAKLEVFDGDAEGTQPLASRDTQDGLAIIDLRDVAGKIKTGSLLAKAKVGKARELSHSLLLRTAESPQPVDRLARGTLRWISLYSATEATQTGRDPACEGLLSSVQASGLVPAAGLQRHPGIGQEVEEDAGWIEEQSAESEPLGASSKRKNFATAQEAEEVPCDERGFHWYIVDPLPKGAPPSTPVEMRCKHCSYSVLHRAKETVQRSPKQLSAKQLAPVPPPSVPEKPQPGSVGRFDMDLVLDALCFLGGGPASRLEGLVAREVEQPWEVLAIAEGLSALGHLELRRQPGSGRLLAWSVAAPVAAMVANDEGFLAGFRNARLVDAVSERLSNAGGRLVKEELPGQPRRLRIEGLSSAKVADALSGLADPHGRSINVVAGPAEALASACLAMRGAWGLERPATLGRPGDLEAYDPSKNKWRKASEASVGAYRTRSAGSMYFHKDKAGNVVQAPHFLVKLMSAREQGLRLHGYEPGSGHFTAVTGCEPPGLLARALCAATGKLPSSKQGRSWYAGIKAGVAATILDVLYPEGAPR